MRGKFIVIYGVNNLGKTTQAKLLTEKLLGEGLPARQIKYPRYESVPAGPLLNEYLRGGNPRKFSSREAQILHFIDKLSFEPVLGKMLSEGINVIAEDYRGTSLAWGMAGGVEGEFIENLNKNLLPEDLAILLDGERFKEAVESGHRHENDAELTRKSRQAHLKLASIYGWNIVNANRGVADVREEIFSIVKKILTIDH